MYKHFFNNLLRQKGHTLSTVEENLLAKASEILNSPQNIFSMLNDADIQFPNIEYECGQNVELTKGNFSTFLENENIPALSCLYNATLLITNVELTA